MSVHRFKLACHSPSSLSTLWTVGPVETRRVMWHRATLTDGCAGIYVCKQYFERSKPRRPPWPWENANSSVTSPLQHPATTEQNCGRSEIDMATWFQDVGFERKHRSWIPNRGKRDLLIYTHLAYGLIYCSTTLNLLLYFLIDPCGNFSPRSGNV